MVDKPCSLKYSIDITIAYQSQESNGKTSSFEFCYPINVYIVNKAIL